MTSLWTRDFPKTLSKWVHSYVSVDYTHTDKSCCVLLWQQVTKVLGWQELRVSCDISQA